MNTYFCLEEIKLDGYKGYLTYLDAKANALPAYYQFPAGIYPYSTYPVLNPPTVKVEITISLL